MDALDRRCALTKSTVLRCTFICRPVTAGLRFLLLVGLYLSLGAGHRTENFLVTAPSESLAREIGDAAEHFREELAYEWLGEPLPRWAQPCPIEAQVGPMGAGGATSFMFENGRPFGWDMKIQGSRERILDSVLPHEVTHTIFATYYGRPLPRWADEGACTSVEHPSERAKQDDMLIRFLKSSPPRSIPFNRMYRMTEYPRDIMTLYAQGHSVARFLLEQGGKRKFVDYVGNGMQTERWDEITHEFYGYRDLSELQVAWNIWVGKGSPSLEGGPQTGTPASALATRSRGGGRSRMLASASPPPLTGTTALPPLLRPTDNEMESVRNAMTRDEKISLAKEGAPVKLATLESAADPSAHSWYARKRGANQNRESARNANTPPPREPEYVAIAPPRSLLPPATYDARQNTGGVVNGPRAMARPHGTQQPSQRVLQWDSRAAQRQRSAGVPFDRGEMSPLEPIYHDAPISDPPVWR